MPTEAALEALRERSSIFSKTHCFYVGMSESQEALLLHAKMKSLYINYLYLTRIECDWSVFLWEEAHTAQSV